MLRRFNSAFLRYAQTLSLRSHGRHFFASASGGIPGQGFGGGDGFLHIGDMRIPLRQGGNKSPQNVPTTLPEACKNLYPVSQETLAHLRWMAQKEQLGQDMCIVGDPGPTRRWLALTYCHYAQREVQFLCLSRDTAEADIKQRKEILDGSLLYVNQAAVTAALNGQVLVIEGLERAERNVLPVINNLLENREMHLDNGMMLLHPDRYDQLLAEHGTKDLLHLGLLRTSEHFRVIGLTVPVPKFPGNPLDPPLRSRFQCLYLTPHSAAAPIALTPALKKVLPQAAADSIQKLRAVLAATEEAGRSGDKPKQFPPLGLFEALLFCQQMAAVPGENPGVALHKHFPWLLLAQNTAKDDVQSTIAELTALLNKYGLAAGPSTSSIRALLEKIIPDPSRPGKCGVIFSTGDVAEATCGSALIKQVENIGSGDFKPFSLTTHFTPSHRALLSLMVQSHCAGRHMVLVGSAGIGKTVMVREFAHLLGYELEPMQLFADMSARDLLQRRTTNAKTGSTSWELSGLMRAALYGRIAVLDGIDQLPPGALSQLQQLFIDGTVTLFDGSIFKSHAEYHALMNELGETPDGMTERKVFCVHTNFRVVATARPPVREGAAVGKAKFWLHGETAAMLDVIVMPDFDTRDTLEVLVAAARQELGPAGEAKRSCEIQTLANALIQLQTALQDRRAADSKVPQLSLRQLLHITKAYVRFPADLAQTLESALLLPLMSPMTAAPIRQLVTAALSQAQTAPQGSRLSGFLNAVASTAAGAKRGAGTEATQLREVVDPSTKRRSLCVGSEEVLVLDRMYSDEEKSLVPHLSTFYANQRHDTIQCWLAKQYASKSNILLVGNQGVGKNKVVDRFLSVAGLPRHYVQLHRDTTVGSLTINPSVVNGRVVWQDSPLVKAVLNGHVLVVDEIDKAPVEVVQVLKGLIEDKEMVLGDGRIIRAPPTDRPTTPPQGTIFVHPDFRIIVLANPPGYPFHGNDFYRECGDLFACFVLENPDAQSQEVLLRQYGPRVPRQVISQLVVFFGQLQKLFEEGAIQYPFSLREMIAVVRHMEAFPQDGLVQALNNVFCFDATDVHAMDHIRRLAHHAFKKTFSVKRGLSAEVPLTRASSSTIEVDKLKSPTSCVVDIVPFATRTIELKDECLDDGAVSEVPGSIPNDVFSELQGRLRVDCLKDGDQVLDLVTSSLIGCTNLVVKRQAKLLLLSVVNGSISTSIGGRRSSSVRTTCVDISPALGKCSRIFMATSPGGGEGAVLVGTSEASSSPALMSIEASPMTAGLLGHVFEFPVAAKDLATCCLCTNLAHEGLVALVDRSNAPNVIHCLYFTVLLRITLPFAILDIRFFSQQLGHIRAADGTQYVLKLDVLHGAAKGTLLELPSTVLPPGAMLSGFSRRETQQTLDTISPALLDGSFAVSTGASGEVSEIGVSQQGNLSVQVFQAPPSHKDHATGGVQVEHKSRQLVATGASSVTVTHADRKTVRSISSNGGSAAIQNTDRQGYSTVFEPQTKTLSTFDVDSERLERQYAAWTGLMDDKSTGLGSAPTPKELSMWYSKPRKQPSGSLKHGEEDPDNTPHVGGNNWAGGTGGTDTAGLGGLVGPYRLDKGHPVHQVSPEDKKKVPKHIIDEAKRMGKQALEERLKEIGLSAEDNARYAECYERVKGPAEQLRQMLSGLKAKESERVWLKHQTDGVWDDGKLVDGIAGEKNIYKRRVDDSDNNNLLQQKNKKRLLFLVDVSASMFRFNGMDGRLSRLIESTVMLMESLIGHEDRIDYAVVGHSGDSARIPLVGFGKPPKDRKERMEVVLKMAAHAQHCWSGDHTVEGMQRAVGEVTAEPGDSYFVFVVSDANLGQYNISPQTLTRIIRSDARVQMFCIFIASLGQESSYIQSRLPPGHGFECFDTKQLPLILKQIFVSTDLLRR